MYLEVNVFPISVQEWTPIFQLKETAKANLVSTSLNFRSPGNTFYQQETFKNEFVRLVLGFIMFVCWRGTGQEEQRPVICSTCGKLTANVNVCVHCGNKVWYVMSWSARQLTQRSGDEEITGLRESSPPVRSIYRLFPRNQFRLPQKWIIWWDTLMSLILIHLTSLSTSIC